MESTPARKSQLIRGQIFKARDDPGASCNGQELDLYPSNPTNSWQLHVVQQMIGLIIETPLADYQGSSSILAFLDHVNKVLALLLLKSLVLLSTVNVYFMLCLRPRRFKGTCQDRHLQKRSPVIDADLCPAASVSHTSAAHQQSQVRLSCNIVFLHELLSHLSNKRKLPHKANTWEAQNMGRSVVLKQLPSMATA